MTRTKEPIADPDWQKGRCACCGVGVPKDRYACTQHWLALPIPVRAAIVLGRSSPVGHPGGKAAAQAFWTEQGLIRT